MLIDALLIIACILCLFVTFSVIMQIWTRIPYVPTPQAVVDTMVRLADLQPQQTVYDLGAGDGRLLTTAKRVEPTVTAIGYELMPSVCLWGRLKAWWQQVDIQLQMRNALQQDLHDADVVFLYLFPEAMRKLAVQFDEQLKPGTKVISHAFQFHDRQPTKVETVMHRRERKIFVYEW